MSDIVIRIVLFRIFFLVSIGVNTYLLSTIYRVLFFSCPNFIIFGPNKDLFKPKKSEFSLRVETLGLLRTQRLERKRSIHISSRGLKWSGSFFLYFFMFVASCLPDMNRYMPMASFSTSPSIIKKRDSWLFFSVCALS